MNMEQSLEILSLLYEIITRHKGWDNAGEQSECRLMLDGLEPEHRQALIDYRDEALISGAFDWATALSHIILAMTDPEFFETA